MTTKEYNYLRAKDDLKRAIATLEQMDPLRPHVNEHKIKIAKDYLYSALQNFSYYERCEE